MFPVQRRKQYKASRLRGSRNGDVAKYGGTRHAIFRNILISATAQLSGLVLLPPLDMIRVVVFAIRL